MRSTGIVRQLDPLGRIVIPKEIRDNMELPEGTPMEIYVEGETIILKKYERGCIFCGTVSNDSIELNDKSICPECKKSIKEGV